MVVIAGVGDVFEDGGDAKEDDVEEHVEEVAEGEECSDLVAQAKEVDNGQGGGIIDRDEKERKQSQVST